MTTGKIVDGFEMEVRMRIACAARYPSPSQIVSDRVEEIRERMTNNEGVSGPFTLLLEHVGFLFKGEIKLTPELEAAGFKTLEAIKAFVRDVADYSMRFLVQKASNVGRFSEGYELEEIARYTLVMHDCDGGGLPLTDDLRRHYLEKCQTSPEQTSAWQESYINWNAERRKALLAARKKELQEPNP